MTLEQATQRATEAADTGDLGQLEQALKDRAAAIESGEAPASPELAVRLSSAAIAGGDAIRTSLAGFRVRTVLEIARLARLRASLGCCAGPARPPVSTIAANTVVKSSRRRSLTVAVKGFEPRLIKKSKQATPGD